jgi:hypothetical protein
MMAGRRLAPAKRPKQRAATAADLPRPPVRSAFSPLPPTIGHLVEEAIGCQACVPREETPPHTRYLAGDTSASLWC